MKVIVHPTFGLASGLAVTNYNPVYLQYGFSEAEILANAVIRGQETGMIPCLDERERRAAMLRWIGSDRTREPNDYPPIGSYHIVERRDLPAIALSEAWYWDEASQSVLVDADIVEALGLKV